MKKYTILSLVILVAFLFSSCKNDPVMFDGDYDTVTFNLSSQFRGMKHEEPLLVELHRGSSTEELKINVGLHNLSTTRNYSLKNSEVVFAKGENITTVEVLYGNIKDYGILESQKIKLGIENDLVSSWGVDTTTITIERLLTFEPVLLDDEENVVQGSIYSKYQESVWTDTTKVYEKTPMYVELAKEDPVLSLGSCYTSGIEILVLFTDKTYGTVAEFPKQSTGLKNKDGKEIYVEYVNHTVIADKKITFNLKFTDSTGTLGTFEETINFPVKK